MVREVRNDLAKYIYARETVPILFALGKFFDNFSRFHLKIMFREVRNDFAKCIYAREVVSRLFAPKNFF